MAPCEILRFDKHEGSAAISVEEDTEELNKEIIPHEKQIDNEKGKVYPSLLLSLCQKTENMW